MLSFETPAGTVSYDLSVFEVRAVAHNVSLRDLSQSDKMRAMRSELKALLQSKCFPPGRTPSPGGIPGTPEHMTRAARAEELASIRSEITVEHIKAADAARALDRNDSLDAHHWLQKEHGKALWKEVDKIIGQLGIKF
jgi:hypothetical protein